MTHLTARQLRILEGGYTYRLEASELMVIVLTNR